MWVLVKSLLFATYGLSAIRSISLPGQDSFQTYSYWETILNAVAVNLLQAAIFLGVLRVALRVERVWISAILVTALVGQLMLGEIDAGARRTVLALAIAYLITRWWASPDRRKLGKEMIVGFCAITAFTIYYPYVRTNLSDPNIQEKLVSGDVSDAMLGVLALFVPNPGSAERWQAPIVREGPMEFLCRITEKQWERQQLTWGTVTGAALYTSIPSAFLANKITTEPDEVVAESYDLYPQEAFIIIDLATSPLAQLQSDFGPVGWFLAPIIYAVVFMVFAAVFVSSKFTVLTRLLALGALWSVAASPEATLTTAASGLRDFLFFSAFIEIARHAYKGVTFALTMESNRAVARGRAEQST